MVQVLEINVEQRFAKIICCASYHDVLVDFDVSSRFHFFSVKPLVSPGPAAEEAQSRVEPVYETLEGWQDTTAGARSWAKLPAQAIKYVKYLEELIECPVVLLSTSPEREDTILMKDPFED